LLRKVSKVVYLQNPKAALVQSPLCFIIAFESVSEKRRMRKLEFYLADVFTEKPFGGNQLAVFTDAAGVSAELMQKIAAELKLSETTFVLPPENEKNDYRVRIFTPAVELPMAGHPTIGTVFVLARQKMIERNDLQTNVNLEEGVGDIPVTIEWRNDAPNYIEMRQPLPVFGSRFTDVAKIAEMLSISPKSIAETNLPMEVVSCGVPFLFVPVMNLETVRKIKFRLETENSFADVHSRMFAPSSGITEDAATGGASGPLGCYLTRHKIFPNAPVIELISEQGLEMGRPSFITIKIEQTGGEITNVRVGGKCCFIGGGYFELP